MSAHGGGGGGNRVRGARSCVAVGIAMFRRVLDYIDRKSMFLMAPVSSYEAEPSLDTHDAPDESDIDSVALAVRVGSLAAVRRLVSHGADVNKCGRRRGHERRSQCARARADATTTTTPRCATRASSGTRRSCSTCSQTAARSTTTASSSR